MTMSSIKLATAFGILAIGVLSIAGCAADTTPDPTPAPGTATTSEPPPSPPVEHLAEIGVATSSPADPVAVDGTSPYQNAASGGGKRKLSP
jgi:hypothetical protein